MGEGWGAGGIRRVTPVVYDDPPSSWEVFLGAPTPHPPPRTNVFLIYRDDPSPPPPKKKEKRKRKKERETEQRKKWKFVIFTLWNVRFGILLRFSAC